jgi:hypothetical protein
LLKNPPTDFFFVKDSRQSIARKERLTDGLARIFWRVRMKFRTGTYEISGAVCFCKKRSLFRRNFLTAPNVFPNGFLFSLLITDDCACRERFTGGLLRAFWRIRPCSNFLPYESKFSPSRKYIFSLAKVYARAYESLYSPL